jgi:hypothetical protein
MSMKSFGYYKNNIDSILESCYGNKKLFKENFHVLMGALKLSKPFREFFTVYNEVEQRKFKNKEELTEYLNESIYYLRPKIKSIKGVCNILERVFNKRKNIIKENNNNIYSHLDYLIYKKGVRNITKRLDVKNNLIESVINKKSSKNLGTKLKPEVLAYTLSENYNKEFKSLSKEDKQVLSEILTIKDQNVNKQFESTRKTILTKINKLVKESKEENLKAKLTETKNVVLKMNSDKLSILRLKQLGKDLN